MEKRMQANIFIQSILTFGLEHIEETTVFELVKRTLMSENVCVNIYDYWRKRKDIKALYNFLKFFIIKNYFTASHYFRNIRIQKLIA